MALPAFLSLFGMANKEKPKGQRLCRCPLGCHSARSRRHGAGRGGGRAAAGVFQVDQGRGDDSAGKAACGRFVEHRPAQGLGVLGRRGVSGHGGAGHISP